MLARMFTIRISQPDSGLDLLCCIPVEDDFMGEERMEFAETPALCIYYRGAYEGIGNAIHALNTYVEQTRSEPPGESALSIWRVHQTVEQTAVTTSPRLLFLLPA